MFHRRKYTFHDKSDENPSKKESEKKPLKEVNDEFKNNLLPIFEGFSKISEMGSSGNEIFILMKEIIQEQFTKNQMDLVTKLRALCFKTLENKSIPKNIMYLENSFGMSVNKLLLNLARHYPINQVDPITQEIPDEDNTVVVWSGYRFDLTNLINYNRERFYRGSSLSESDTSKFLVNPLNNLTFTAEEHALIIRAATHHNPPLDLNFLSNNSVPGATSLGYSVFTPNLLALFLSKIKAKPNNSEINEEEVETPPTCKLIEDSLKFEPVEKVLSYLGMKNGNKERDRIFAIDNNKCIRLITINQINNQTTIKIYVTFKNKNWTPTRLTRPGDLSAVRNGLFADALKENGIEKNTQGINVERYPNKLYIDTNALVISGDRVAIKKVWPQILNAIKQVESPFVFDKLEQEIYLLLGELQPSHTQLSSRKY